MPKAAKKKKEKTADFKKAKLKLGKGKQLASNATDTSFKARSIALPGQSAVSRAITTAGEPTTAGGLTLDEVLLRFRHPNGGVRKESLGGVKDILSADVGREVGKVVRALGGLVSDDDAGVRKALVGFLAWYLPAIPQSILTPHLPLLLLQTSSALSHIFPEIRLDACRLVALLLDHVPQHIVGTWPSVSASASSSKTTLDGGNNILEGLRLAVGLGGEKGATAASGKLGANGRLVTLKTLLDFVKSALSQDSAEDVFSGWLEDSQDRGKGKGKGKAVMVGREAIMFEGSLVPLTAWGLEWNDGAWDLNQLANGSLENEEGTQDALTDLYLQLAPLLQSTFLESAPTAFSPSSAPPSTLEIPTALCLTSASLTHVLAGELLKAKPSTDVRHAISDFLRRMAPYFPFRSPSQATSSPTGLTPALELNIVYANLAILLAPPTPELSAPKASRKELGWRERVKSVEEAWKEMREVNQRKSKGKRNGDGWAMDEVAEWIIETLAPSRDALAPALTATTYAALLPIVWSLLIQPPASPTSDDDLPTSVGTAFFSHLLRQNSSSSIRALGDQFVIDLIAAHEQRHLSRPFFILPSSATRPLLKQWVETVPKAIWELGDKDELATERLLRFLLDVGLRGPDAFQKPYSLLSSLVFSDLAKKLAPFFHLVHPQKGSISGPWTRLASLAVRRLGLDMALVWSKHDAVLAGAVKAAVERSEVDRLYWTARA